MTFLVQNDTGTVSGANSYNTVQEFRDYWTDRGVDYSSLTDTDVEYLLIKATDYVDTRFIYEGSRLEKRDQSTEFPRSCLYDSECNEVEGVPDEIKQAVNEYAAYQNTTDLFVNISSTSSGIRREKKKVGPIMKDVEYQGSSSSNTYSTITKPDNIIRNSGFTRTNFAWSFRA